MNRKILIRLVQRRTGRRAAGALWLAGALRSGRRAAARLHRATPDGAAAASPMLAVPEVIHWDHLEHIDYPSSAEEAGDACRAAPVGGLRHCNETGEQR